jgi:hypothetical protein
VEVPISASILPYIGTTMRLIPGITRIQRSLLHFETCLTNKPVVFDIHPNEFIDESDSPRKIARRSKNPVSYIFADIIRSHLKIKNLGPQCLPLFFEMLEFYNSKEYRFETVNEYASKLNL